MNSLESSGSVMVKCGHVFKLKCPTMYKPVTAVRLWILGVVRFIRKKESTLWSSLIDESSMTTSTYLGMSNSTWS